MRALGVRLRRVRRLAHRRGGACACIAPAVRWTRWRAAGVERRRARVQTLAGRLEALSPLATLHRGYAVARDRAGHVLGSVRQFAKDDEFQLTVRDGEVSARVTGHQGGCMSFESRLKRLEEIVSELESDTLDLERSLTLFEEGIACLRDATSELARAEAQVQRLVEHADGTFEVTDLRD